ncbi:MAG: inosine/xanthosine triphosphatase [Candidatus Syntropharchaeia archaeon]
MKIAVGSKNPVKIKAVKNVLSKFYRDLEVISVEVDSGVPDQPVGEETIKGAINRAKSALRLEKVDLGVGIEAGLFEVPGTITGYVDVQWCAIADNKGRITLGCGSGFEYPPEVLRRVFDEKKEIGEIMDEVTGIKDLGEKYGAIGILTKGVLDRTTMTEECVLMAMIPRVNEKFYFG